MRQRLIFDDARKTNGIFVEVFLRGFPPCTGVFAVSVRFFFLVLFVVLVQDPFNFVPSVVAREELYVRSSLSAQV